MTVYPQHKNLSVSLSDIKFVSVFLYDRIVLLPRVIAPVLYTLLLMISGWIFAQLSKCYFSIACD